MQPNNHFTFGALLHTLKRIENQDTEMRIAEHVGAGEYKISEYSPSWHMLNVKDLDGQRIQLVLSRRNNKTRTVRQFIADQKPLVLAMGTTGVEDRPLDFPLYYWDSNETKVYNVARKNDPSLMKLDVISHIANQGGMILLVPQKNEGSTASVLKW